MENLEQELAEVPPRGTTPPPTLRAHVVQMLSAGSRGWCKTASAAGCS
jgi:hypothetical protein